MIWIALAITCTASIFFNLFAIAHGMPEWASGYREIISTVNFASGLGLLAVSLLRLRRQETQL